MFRGLEPHHSSYSFNLSNVINFKIVWMSLNSRSVGRRCQKQILTLIQLPPSLTIAIPPLLSHQPMHQQMPNIIICRRIFKHAITPLHYRYRIIAAIRSRQIVINCHTTITIQPSPSHHCYRTSKCTNQCQTTQFLNLIF